eukprot:PhM_4_TR16404/c0_g1_i1/m.59963/K04638/IFT57, HIPPI, ESRRBL1; intraflagellar transport protein 57
MSDEAATTAPPGSAGASTPSASTFTPIAVGSAVVIDDYSMEDLIDRLKVLDYERSFCAGKNGNHFKPLTRTYFTVASDNPNAQFFYFTSIAAWLMSLCGHEIEAPGQFDDPTSSTTLIMVEMKRLDFVVNNIAPNRLRTGHGDAVLQVLLMLADKAMQCRAFQFRGVEYPADAANVVEEEIEGDAEGPDVGGGVVVGGAGAGGITDFIDDDGDTESEEEFFDPRMANRNAQDADKDMIEPTIPAEEWMVEVERLGPQLKFAPHEDGKDWRVHLETTTSLLQSVDKSLPTVLQILSRHTEDIQKAVEKIAKREHALAVQFQELVDKYRLQLKDYEVVQKECTRVNEGVTSASSALNKLTEDLDRVKQEITQREEKMSDTTPLISIKDAVSRMRAEIKEMSLRIGVLQHTVLHYTIQQGRGRSAQATRTSVADVLDRSMDIE